MKKIYEKPELNINILSSINVFATSGVGNLQDNSIYNGNDEVVEWDQFFD